MSGRNESVRYGSTLLCHQMFSETGTAIRKVTKQARGNVPFPQLTPSSPRSPFPSQPQLPSVTVSPVHTSSPLRHRSQLTKKPSSRDHNMTHLSLTSAYSDMASLRCDRASASSRPCSLSFSCASCSSRRAPSRSAAATFSDRSSSRRWLVASDSAVSSSCRSWLASAVCCRSPASCSSSSERDATRADVSECQSCQPATSETVSSISECQELS